jgi:hypothetical protein
MINRTISTSLFHFVYVMAGLGSDEAKLIEACLRCLRTIFEFPCAPVGLICQDDNLPLRLLSLIPHSVSNQVCVATILTAGCKVRGHQDLANHSYHICMSA